MSGTLSARQLEATRRAIVKKLQKKGKLWTKVFPSTPITNKPSESRMGKGKGTVSFWGIKVAKGCVLFEICGVPLKTAREAFMAGSHKLPVKTKIIYQWKTNNRCSAKEKNRVLHTTKISPEV